MTRAMAIDLRTDRMGWDFVYPTVVFALGVAATAAIFIQVSGL